MAAKPPRRLSQHISDAFARAFTPQQATVATNTPPASGALSGLSGPLMDSVPFMVTLISCSLLGIPGAPPSAPTSSVLFQNKRSRDYHGPYDCVRPAGTAPAVSSRVSAGGLDQGLDLLRNMFSMSSDSEAVLLLEVGSSHWKGQQGEEWQSGM